MKVRCEYILTSQSKVEEIKDREKRQQRKRARFPYMVRFLSELLRITIL